MATIATRSASAETTRAQPRSQSRRATTAAVVSDAAGALKSVTEDAAARLPGIAATGRSTFDDANRRIAAGSDEMVRLGTAMSFGFAIGLLIGGANRLLVGAAFVPVCMLGLALLDRFAIGRPSTVGTKGAAGL